MFQWCKHLSYGGRLYSSSWAFEVVFGTWSYSRGRPTAVGCSKRPPWSSRSFRSKICTSYITWKCPPILLRGLMHVAIKSTWCTTWLQASKKAPEVPVYGSELPTVSHYGSQGTLVRGCSNNGIWILPRDLVIDRHDVVWRLKAEGHSSLVCTDCLRAIPAQGGGTQLAWTETNWVLELSKCNLVMQIWMQSKHWNTGILCKLQYMTGLQSLALCLLTHHD